MSDVNNIKSIVLPDEEEHSLVFYLAMEEFLARNITGHGCFFVWRTAPTVIFGRNQVMEAEVNLPYCRDHGIKVFRRKSGGGCVYSDRGNLMHSCIVKGDDVGFVFDRYLRRIALVLNRLGIKAGVDGRNDILVDGLKVSGNAFYKLPGKCIIHGTMLFDTDFERMEAALRPSGHKLESKGIASVRQRVANLKDYTDIGIDVLASRLGSALCDGERVLTAGEIEKIKEIEATYLDEDFIKGRNPSYTIEKEGKVPEIGEFVFRISLNHDCITDVYVEGDFFQTGDFSAALSAALKGCRLRPDDILHAVSVSGLAECVPGLVPEDIVRILSGTPGYSNSF